MAEQDISNVVNAHRRSSVEREFFMSGKYQGKLSKDLPGGRVEVPAGSETKSYYKYYLEPFEGIPQELKQRIEKGFFEKGNGLEIADRKRLQQETAFPAEPGCYLLEEGGAMSCANVKVPNITKEAFAWWADWHGLDPLRYALWDNKDHYALEVENKDRLLDASISVGERIWGTKHHIFESLVGDEPQELFMEFFDPRECGYDADVIGTDRWLYGICAAAGMGGKIPVFATEVLVKGEDDVNEIRCRFWIGYERQPDGTIVCKLPKAVVPPKEFIQNLVQHNYSEFMHLNKILPRLYEEEKDNWL